MLSEVQNESGISVYERKSYKIRTDAFHHKLQKPLLCFLILPFPSQPQQNQYGLWVLHNDYYHPSCFSFYFTVKLLFMSAESSNSSMSRILCILYLIISVITIKGQELFNTSEAQIESQIDAAIKFMCINQFKSNGQFLYEIELTNDSILIDVEKNNYPRQGGGLYGIGMYYRLNHNKHNTILKGFSIINCIDNTMRYLQSHSKTIKSKYISNNNENINGELISGNTGATSLAFMGLIDICIINDNICSKYSSQFELWLHGLITMRNHKLITIDNNTLHKGAFAKKTTTNFQNKSSLYYDSESYVVLSKLLQYKQHLITNIVSNNNKIWTDIRNILERLDEYYIEFRGEDDAHWLIQAWYNRWVLLNSQNTNTIDNFVNYYMIEILMKNTLNSPMNIEYSGARCYLVEANTDVMYAVNVLINNSKHNNQKQNNSLYIWNDLLYKILNNIYIYFYIQSIVINTKKYYYSM